MIEHQSYGRGALPPLAAGLRVHDPDRFLTALFARASDRPDLIALYEFNYEIARTREAVSEPGLGRIRLEWWRESIAAIYDGGTVRRHAVVESLARAVRGRNLSRAHLDALIDARAFDLEGAPPADLGALEAYARATSVPLVKLALEALGVRAAAAEDAAEGVGVAYALAGLLRATRFHAAQRRLYLPADMVSARGIELHRSLFELKWDARLGEVAAAVADRARVRLEAARALRASVPRAAMPALLPGVLAGRTLRALARAGYDLLSPRLLRPDGGKGAALMLAALRRRY